MAVPLFPYFQFIKELSKNSPPPHVRKRKVRKYTGACDQCKRERTLFSYEAAEWQYVFFDSLRIYVFDYCQTCHSFKNIPVRERQRRAREILAEAWSRYNKRPGNAELAAEIVTACYVHQEEDEFLPITKVLENKFTNNPQIRFLLGRTHAEFGDYANAERHFRAALAIEDKPDVRGLLAESIILQNRPSEGAPYLDHITDQDEDGLELLLMLVRGYQAEGLHGEALEVIGRCRDLQPEIGHRLKLNDLENRSNKNRKSGKRIGKRPPDGYKGNPFDDLEGQYKPQLKSARIAVTMALVVAFGIYLLIAFAQGKSGPVYLVNGLNRPYTVSVNGQEKELPPLEEVKFRVHEGEVTVQVLDTELNLPEQTVLIRTPFWSRPFKKPLYIVNPDAVATLLWETLIYRDYGESEDDYQTALLCGDAFYEFNGIHLKFREFPESIMSIAPGSITKKRVSIWGFWGEDPTAAIEYLVEYLGAEKTQDLIAERYRLGDKRPEYTTFLNESLAPEDFIIFIKPYLDDRPIRVEDHQYYQDMATVTNDVDDIEAQYRELLDREPHAASYYLLARVVSDHKEEDALLHQSIDWDPPEPNAFYRLGVIRMSEARFKEASSLLSRASVFDMNDSGIMLASLRALAASGQADLALLTLDSFSPSYTDWFQHAEHEFSLWVIKGDPARGEEVIKESIDTYPGDIEPEVKIGLQFHLTARLAYASGDMERFVKLSERESGDGGNLGVRFRRALTAGDRTEAEKVDGLLIESHKARGQDIRLLLLYISARLDDDPEAESYLSKATEIMDSMGGEVLPIARALAGEVEPDLDRLLQVRTELDAKKVYLTALGVRFPEHRAPFFEMARALNYWPGFPHQILEDAFSEFGDEAAEIPES